MKTQLNELALFAGAGGGLLGGKLLGWRTVCAVEWDGYARDVLVARQNDGCLEAFPIWDDVQTFDGKPWRGLVDVVSGGFPCQDISAAGKGAGIEGERSSMWKHMARIIGEVRPQYAFVENSPMLVGRGLSTVLSDLAEMGYDAEWGIVGAHHVSAPHKRDRIWIVAKRSGQFPHSKHDRTRWREQQSQSVEEKARDVATDSTLNPREQWRTKCAGLQRAAWAANGGDDMADTAGLHDRGGKTGTTQRQAQESRESSGADDVAYPSSQRGCSRNTQWKYAEDARESSRHKGNNARRVGWWDSEPNVGRVAHGVAARVDRLRCIGNGQVSAVAKLAWNTLNL